MLSNSCRYGIRAVIYIARQPREKGKTGIKQISNDLNLPTPFLAKILQQLSKQKILRSTKGPHGGFALVKDPKKITLFDIVRTIDGDEIFTNCIVHNRTCAEVEKQNDLCALHDDYGVVRKKLIDFFNSKTIYDMVKKADTNDTIVI